MAQRRNLFVDATGQPPVPLQLVADDADPRDQGQHGDHDAQRGARRGEHHAQRSDRAGAEQQADVEGVEPRQQDVEQGEDDQNRQARRRSEQQRHRQHRDVAFTLAVGGGHVQPGTGRGDGRVQGDVQDDHQMEPTGSHLQQLSAREEEVDPPEAEPH